MHQPLSGTLVALQKLEINSNFLHFWILVWWIVIYRMHIIITQPLVPTLSVFGFVFVDFGCFTSQVSNLVVEGNFNPLPLGSVLSSLITLPDLSKSVQIIRSDLQTLPSPSIIEFWLHFGWFGVILECFGIVWMLVIFLLISEWMECYRYYLILCLQI